MIVINTRHLPAPIRVRSYRTASLIWAVARFGVLTALTASPQIGQLLRS